MSYVFICFFVTDAGAVNDADEDQCERTFIVLGFLS